MPTLFFAGNQVAFFSSIEDDGDEVEIDISQAPFQSTDTVEIEINDADIGTNGEFDSSEVRFSRVTVIRDGVRYDLDVNPGSKVKESGGGGAKEQGDTFFTTNDSVGLAASGPFSGISGGQLVFSITDTFESGEGEEIDRVRTFDHNGDGDTSDSGESGNGTFNATSVLVCYCPGTLIRTASGHSPVESLKPGDLVLTLDQGLQPIRWIGQTRHCYPPGPHDRKPIEFKPDSLGPGVPRRRLIVSPQHRLLVRGCEVEALCGVSEVLALAKALVGLDHVRAMNGKREATFFSVLLENHQVLVAEGALSESFYPGPTALRMILPEHRTAIETLFPGVRENPVSGYGPTARRVLTRAETERLAQRIKSTRSNARHPDAPFEPSTPVTATVIPFHSTS